MRKIVIAFALLLGSLTAGAQRDFVFSGTVGMPDGTEVGLSCTTDSSVAMEVAHGVVRRGRFELRGRVDRPYVGMLTTNNLKLVERHKWPTDSIRWTYTDVYVDNDAYTVSPSLEVKGGSVQSDFNDLQRMGGARGDSVWAFIAGHPQSAVSVWLANGLLQRAYNLTDAQVARLSSTITGCPLDPAGYARFTRSLAAARLTTIGSPLASLELRGVDNAVHELTDVVPRGKYTLLDFWASWCGICLYSMPQVKALAAQYADVLGVLGISIDTKDDAWRKGMEKHPAPWPQYCTTPSGYRDLTDKFQIGNGVPYYLLVAPDGRVVGSPDRPDDAERMLLRDLGRSRVTGKVEQTVDGDSVFLCSMQGFFAMVPEDTAIVRDGAFAFDGPAEGAALRYIVAVHGGETVSMAPFIHEPGLAVLDIRKDEAQTTVDGGENQRLWERLQREEAVYSEAMDQPWRTVQDSTLAEGVRAAAQVELDSLGGELRAFHKRFIIDHMPSALSDMLYGYYGSEFTDDDQTELLRLMGERQPQYPVYKAAMAERAATAATAIGCKYTDIVLADPAGNTIRVSDYVSHNRYTLIDFWASWCGPCRAEMPNVVKAYAKYHKKGFEVVGVSLDNNRAAWLKAIKQLNMPWPQMSDLKGWESVGAAAYNVKAIPANVLVDRDGNIVAKDLRAEELQERLAQLFK